MSNVLERLIGQLNTLVPFMSLSHQKVFETVRDNYAQWVPREQQETMPETFSVYRGQVVQSAFLLGYSYFEAFLADLIREIYSARKSMLPQDKEIRFSDVLRFSDYESVMSMMIDKEVKAAMYDSMEKIVQYFEKKLNLLWPQSEKDTAVRASLLRNCILHNGAVADARLARIGTRWSVGDEIELTEEDVNQMGIDGRTIARHLWEEAVRKHLNS